MITKIVKWFIFSVIIALLPIIFNLLIVLSNGVAPSLEILTSRGELLLVAAGIAASAIGELIASGQNYMTPKLLAGGSCVIILSLASLYFAHISATIILGKTLDANVVSYTSMYLYIFAILSGASCIVLAEV